MLNLIFLSFVFAYLSKTNAQTYPDCKDLDLANYAHVLPDLTAVRPTHLDIWYEQVKNAAGKNEKHELLRFTNGIANLGPGVWELEPEYVRGDMPEDLISDSYQRFVSLAENEDDVDEVICRTRVSTYEFHPFHNHWHTTGVALFEVLDAYDPATGEELPPPTMLCSEDGTGRRKTRFEQQTKLGACLLDLDPLAADANTQTRRYWDCYYGLQGVSPGWVDQYHHSLADQEIDITGIEPGTYYLHTVSNPQCGGVDYYTCEELPLTASSIGSLEADCSNNDAWVKFTVSRNTDNNQNNPQEAGNIKIEIIDASPCPSEPELIGLCGSRRNV